MRDVVKIYSSVGAAIAGALSGTQSIELWMKLVSYGVSIISGTFAAIIGAIKLWEWWQARKVKRPVPPSPGPE